MASFEQLCDSHDVLVSKVPDHLVAVDRIEGVNVKTDRARWMGTTELLVAKLFSVR